MDCKNGYKNPPRNARGRCLLCMREWFNKHNTGRKSANAQHVADFNKLLTSHWRTAHE
jgi:hypothetical protein